MLVTPCVQLHIRVPGISSFATEMLPVVSLQAAAIYVRWRQMVGFVLKPVISFKDFPISSKEVL